jgi:hypothetical protein
MQNYQLTHTSSIIRLSDGAFIPYDPLNSDYATYLAWVSAGNTALPAAPPDNSSAVTASEKSLLIDQANTHVAGGDLTSAVKILIKLHQGA